MHAYQSFHQGQCFAMHMMTCPVLGFKTPGVLQSFPLKKSRPEIQSHRISNGKGNVSIQKHPQLVHTIAEFPLQTWFATTEQN